MQNPPEPPAQDAVAAGPPPEAPAPEATSPRNVADGDFVYRPLSGVAVAGVVVSGVFAAVLMVFGAVALVRGEPFLLPLWLLLLPVTGVILSLLGRWHIQRSEDTRAGLALARWGLRIGVVAGLAYGVYYLATYLAVTNQSNSFLVEKGPDSGYLERLRDGDVYSAFILTQTLTKRGGANPNDPAAMLDQYDAPGDKEPRGLLTLFLADPLVRRLSAPGAKAEFEPRGVSSWSFEGGGYRVERLYRIRTREGEFEVLLTTQSAQSRDGERKWMVHWTPKQGLPPLTMNEEGKKLDVLRRQTAAFANQWFIKMMKGQQDPRHRVDAFLDTQPPAARLEMLKKATALLRVQQALTLSPGQPLAAAATVLPEVFSPALLPGFDDFLDGSACFHGEQLRAPEQLKILVRDRLRYFVKAPPQGQFTVQIKPDDMQLAVVRDAGPEPVTVTHRIEFPIALVPAAGKQQQLWLVSGEVVVELPAAANNAPLPPRIARVNFLNAIPTQMPQGPPGG
jgi:hypothetical protein